MNDTWKNKETVQAFYEIRGGLPYGKDQADIMIQLIEAFSPKPKRILDLGCGDGTTGAFLLDLYSDATGHFVDFSPPMLKRAAKRLEDYPNTELFQENLETDHLVSFLPTTYDCIVSSYALHHLTDQRKKEMYKEIYNLLNPGGIFLNIEHVASRSMRIEAVWNESMIQHIYRYRKQKGDIVTLEEVRTSFTNREDQDDNILAFVDDQCEWLREIGFVDVDIFFKYFELAVFGGCKS